MTKGLFLAISFVQFVLCSTAMGVELNLTESAAGFVQPSDYTCGSAPKGSVGLIQACVGSLETPLTVHPFRFVNLTFRQGQSTFSKTHPLDLLPEQAPDFHNLEDNTIYMSFAIYHLDPLGSNYGSLVLVWNDNASFRSHQLPDKMIVYPPKHEAQRFEFTDIKRRSSIELEEQP